MLLKYEGREFFFSFSSKGYDSVVRWNKSSLTVPQEKAHRPSGKWELLLRQMRKTVHFTSEFCSLHINTAESQGHTLDTLSSNLFFTCCLMEKKGDHCLHMSAWNTNLYKHIIFLAAATTIAGCGLVNGYCSIRIKKIIIAHIQF